jgi:hypothetical protein
MTELELELEKIYFVFGSSYQYNNDLLDIENIGPFRIPSYQIRYIKNIIINTLDKNNPFSIANIDLRYLQNYR